MNENFKSVLKQLREKFDLTQDDLADILGVGKSTVSSYERGINMPNVEFLENIADYFNVTTDYLLGRTTQIRKVNMQKYYKIPEQINEDSCMYLIKMFNQLVKRELGK